MTLVLERSPHTPGKTRKTGRNRLLSTLAGWFRRSAGQPTRLEPDRVSDYMLKDIGLSYSRSSGFDSRSARSGMDWPMR